MVFGEQKQPGKLSEIHARILAKFTSADWV
jgi:hypothetical protein